MRALATYQSLLQAIETLAIAALPRWGLAGASVRLVNNSENATYFVTARGAAAPVVLRVHREDYHTIDGIRSELAWMRALEAEAGVKTPQAIPGLDGKDVQTVAHPALPRPRNCVLFAFIEGEEPAQDQLVAPFKQLGEVTARTHAHSMGWKRPPWFRRLTWDFDHTLGATPNWGSWTDGPDMAPDRRALLQRLVDTLEARLARFGKAPERYGLIHADFRLANLLIKDGDVRVIDFDDSGFGWYFYDAATALSFIEHRPDADELMAAWIEGYRRIRPITPAEETEIPTFVMLRRMTLLAWIGSHGDTDLARDEGPAFTRHTCDLAERYLSRRS